jgi:cytochrome c553
VLAENLKIIGVVVGTIGLFTLVANSIPQVQSEVPQDLSFGTDVTATELTASGELLFGSAGGCTACHGLGTRAPNLLTGNGSEGPIGARCGDRVTGESCKEYLYRAMIEPNVFLVEGYSPIMPDMRRSLSNDQIWALVAYLEAQGGEVTVTGADINQEGEGEAQATMAAAPVPAGPTSDATDPLEILRANACLGCHVLSGEGAPIGPGFDGIGGRVSADYIRESILKPSVAAAEGYEAFAGLMPAIYANQLTAGQLENVVMFLAELR